MKKDRITIFIAEDDKFYGKLLEAHLNRYFSNRTELNPEIHFCYNARDLLLNLKKTTDIVVLDYYLEDENGNVPVKTEELIRSINHYCENCKIIIISGKAELTEAFRLFELGIDDFISKSEKTTELLNDSLENLVRDL